MQIKETRLQMRDDRARKKCVCVRESSHYACSQPIEAMDCSWVTVGGQPEPETSEDPDSFSK